MNVTSGAGGPAAAAAAAVVVSLPDRLERQLIDVEQHLLPFLIQAAKDGGLDDGERDLHDGLARAEEELNVWAIDVVDMGRNEEERRAWSGLLGETQKRLARLRLEAGKQLLEARRTELIEQQQRQQRDRLAAYSNGDGGGSQRGALLAEMSSSEEERRRRRNLRTQDQTADEQLMTASGDVTAALQRAVKLMSTELEKSSYSAQLLDESSVSLQQATVQYTSFSSLVLSSRKLIASMERADLVDAVLLLLSLLFFFGCILYIVKVRVWDRGVGIVSFFLRFLGVASSRSPADIKEKLAMARQAAGLEASSASSSSRLAAKLAQSALSVSAAASASAVSAASAAAAALQSSSASAASLASQASAAASAALSSSEPEPTSALSAEPTPVMLERPADVVDLQHDKVAEETQEVWHDGAAQGAAIEEGDEDAEAVKVVEESEADEGVNEDQGTFHGTETQTPPPTQSTAPASHAHDEL